MAAKRVFARNATFVIAALILMTMWQGAGAATKYWVGGDGTWNATNVNWSLTSGGTANQKFAAGDDAIFDDTACAVTAALPNNPNSITFNVSGYSVSGSTITLNPTGAGIINVNVSGIATISSVIAGNGTVALNKTGVGALTLSGANTYTGGTTLSAGQLNINSATAIGTGAITYGSGTTIDNTSGGPITLKNNNAQVWNGNYTFAGTNALTMGTGAVSLGTNCQVTANASTFAVGGVISGGYSLTQAGAGTITLSGANTFTGGFTLNGGTLNINNASALGNAAGTFTIAAGTTINNTTAGAITMSNYPQTWNGNFTFTGTSALNMGTGSVSLGANSQITVDASTLTVGGVVGGGYSLSQTGAGTLTLSGANTFTGGFTLNAGTLNINNASALGNAAGKFTIAAGTTINNTAGGAITLVNYPQIWNGNYTFTGANALNMGAGAVSTGANCQVTVGASTLTVGGVISGGHALTKAGAGTLTISGANTYTGATTINAGTLAAGSTSAFGTNSAVVLANTAGAVLNITGYNNSIGSLTGGGAAGGNVTLGAATLTVGGDNTSPAAYAGIISGTGAVIKTGTGTLTLTAANTFTGGFTLNGGTMNINNASALGTAAGIFTIAGGTTINNTTGEAITMVNHPQTWNGNFTFTGTNTLNMGAGAVTLGANTQVTLGASTLTVGGVISGGYSLAEAGAGILTLSGANTFTGGFSLNAGTLNINNASALGNAAGTFTIAPGTTINNTTGGTVTMVNYPQAWNGNFTFTGTNNLNMGTGAVALGANTQVTLGANTLTVGGAISGGYSLTQTGAGTLTLSGTNTFTGGFTLNAGTLNINNGSALGAATGTFTIAGGTTINNTAGALTMSNYPQAWNGNFTFTGTSSLNMGTGTVSLGANCLVTANASTLTVGGLISGGYSLAKAGAGTLTLSGANSFTGGFTLNAGTLNINNSSALGAATGIFTIAGGTINSSTGGSLTMANYPQAWNANFTFAGTNNLNMGTGAVSLGTNCLVTVNGSTLTVGGVIGGGYSLAQAGGGTLTLSGANTFTGGFTLNAGTLNINNASALGNAAGTFTIAGGTINTTAGALTMSNYPQAWNGNFTFGGTNALNMGAGAVSPGANCQVTVNASTLTVGGAISGGYSLTKAGGGTLTFAGSNTYTGATIINAGTLAAGSTSAFGNSAVTVANAAGAILNITGYNNSIGSLTGGGAAGGTVVLGAATLTVGSDNTSPAAYAGIISGTGALIKTGTGTITLSGANTYTGTTTISGGMLSVNGSTAPGSAVTVQSGGTLGGTGTVNGAVTVSNGGTIEPTLSGSTGTLTLSNATGPAFNATSTLKIKAPSSTADIVYLSNAGAIFNAAGVPLVIDVTGLSGPVTGVTIVQVAKPAGGISGTFSSVTAGGCYTPAVHYNATSITVDLNLSPTIAANPSNASVISGQTATFSVTATGTGTLSYQWYKNSALITSGATAATYTTPATVPTDNGSAFYCVVTNTCSPGSASSTSTSATLTVNVPPSITTQPANQSATAGLTATFTVGATGSPTLTYQWYKNSASILGATLSSYTTPATSTSDNGAQFYCVATNPYGSATSTNATLTVTPLSAPALSLPASGATGVALNSTLSWGSVATASSYELQVSLSAGFSSTVYDQPGLTSTSQAVTGVTSNNTMYYWRVNASNAGATSSWSTVSNFTTIVAAPPAPALASPSTGATTLPSPTLSWNNAAGATSYELQVSASSDFLSIVYDQSGLTSTSLGVPGAATNNTVYYWRVNATNAGGTSGWSSAWNFTVIYLPTVPALVSPANGATGVSVSPALTWTSATGATGYRLQIFSDPALSTLAYQKDSITGTTWTVAVSLLNSTQYYWRVDAKNISGYGAYSDTFNFTTIIAKPLVPALVSPATGATGVSVSPALTWTSATGATGYRLQIFSDPALSTLAYQKDSITGTTWTVAVSLLNNTQYYWRVGAKNAGGYSGYSDTFNFTTIVAKPLVPALVSPATGTTGVSVSPALTWTSATGATGYRVQIFSDAALSTLAYQKDSITGTTWTVAIALSNSTQYYWRVGAKNAGGYSGYSDTFNFTTIIAKPLVPALVSPATGATGVSVSPALTWTSATGATGYRVQIFSDPALSTLAYQKDSITGTTWTVAIALSNSTQYYWRVGAKNAGGYSGYSDTFSFTSIVAKPSVPALVSPATGATGVSVSPALTWTSSTGATGYRVQIFSDAALSTLACQKDSITGTTWTVAIALSNSTQYYWRVGAKNAGGYSGYSDTFNFTTIIATPQTPTIASPINGAAGTTTSPTLAWNASTGATSYGLQMSTVPDFSSVVYSFTGLTATSQQITGLSNNSVYYWQINAANAAGTSQWSAVSSFTTVRPQSVIANVGWNMISFNMHPVDSSCATLFGSLPGIVLVKNNNGQVYWPLYGVNTIGSVATGQGYQLYTDTLDTITIPGTPYNVATTPISLGAGWNMFAYLPQSSMDITTALAGITSQITIVKDNNGDVYWPEYSINNIGMMNPGQGYMSYMNQAVTLTYPDAGAAKRAVTADKTIALPLAKHYVLNKNTGVSATILATDVSLCGKPAADGVEVGAYDDQGNLVGSGVVMKGATAFSVWGKNSQKKIKDGLTKGEAINLKLWDGSKEYPLEFSESGSKSLAKMSYSDNGVFLGSLSVPSSYFIKACAVHGTCMAGSGIMKIMFDVAYDAKTLHELTINLFDVSGRLVRQIASGEYAAGHYTVMWNGSTTGAGMYIVQMKAESFDSKVRLMIVR